MLTINQTLKQKPTFILAVNYDAGSLGDMLGEDRDLDIYLAEMTIQYHTITCNACIAFTIECLVQVTGDTTNNITIDEMDTCYDSWSVYANNIESLPNDTMQVWDYDLDADLHTKLVELMESQPINDIPEHFTIESY